MWCVHTTEYSRAPQRTNYPHHVGKPQKHYEAKEASTKGHLLLNSTCVRFQKIHSERLVAVGDRDGGEGMVAQVY